MEKLRIPKKKREKENVPNRKKFHLNTNIHSICLFLPHACRIIRIVDAIVYIYKFFFSLTKNIGVLIWDESLARNVHSNSFCTIHYSNRFFCRMPSRINLDEFFSFIRKVHWIPRRNDIWHAKTEFNGTCCFFYWRNNTLSHIQHKTCAHSEWNEIQSEREKRRQNQINTMMKKMPNLVILCEIKWIGVR